MAVVPASSHGVDTSQANTWTANQTAPAWIASGLTGATAASRYVGATASGAPGSGTFAVGDFIIDQSGKIYVCTSAGSPGTWTQAGAGATYAAYTATLTASGGGLNIGSTGTMPGRYAAVGKFVHCFGVCTFGGSGVAAGTGTYNIALPVAASASAVTLVGVMGAALLFQSPNAAQCQCELIDANNLGMRYIDTVPTGTQHAVGAALPWTWASGNFIRFGFVYEAA